ncbi:MAG: glycosyltransferase [Thermoanaerobaculia bacterium]
MKGALDTLAAATRVVRGEGVASAASRARERLSESLRAMALRSRAAFVRPDPEREMPILNVSAMRLSARLGGVPVQLAARLRAERSLRNVALLHPGGLDLSAPSLHTRRGGGDLSSPRGFTDAVRNALAFTGSTAIHLEGMHGIPIASVLSLAETGVHVVLSLHDFSLFCARPHLFEMPAQRFCGYSRDPARCTACLCHDPQKDERDEKHNAEPGAGNDDRRALGARLLAAASGLIFPSRFLLEKHRALFSLPELSGAVVEPGPHDAVGTVRLADSRPGLAYAGSVKRHKGAHLLPEVIRGSVRNSSWHIHGGGDEDILRELRSIPGVTVHGHYRAGALPALLARDGIGLVVLPSIVPESYGLVISEAWRAGAAVAAFDLGAPAERIGRDGGGFLVPLESGAAGLADLVNRWSSGDVGDFRAATPASIPSASTAARATVNLYSEWKLMKAASGPAGAR